LNVKLLFEFLFFQMNLRELFILILVLKTGFGCV